MVRSDSTPGNFAYLYVRDTKYWDCYVTISVFNQSRPGQRINSLHVIETDAAHRNPRFRSIPSGKLPRMGLEKKNLFASEINQLII